MDFEYRPSSIRRLSGAVLASDVNGETGYGLTIGYGHDPSKNRHNGVGVYYFDENLDINDMGCLLYTSPSPRDATLSRMPSSA